MITRRAIAISGVLALALALLGGCGGAAGSGPAKMFTQRQTLDQVMIAVEMPERPALLTEQTVVVSLADPNGAAIDGAEVWLALIMPTMRMSPNEPDAQPLGAGRYQAAVIFTMAGAWILKVHANVQGRERVAAFRVVTQ